MGLFNRLRGTYDRNSPPQGVGRSKFSGVAASGDQRELTSAPRGGRLSNGLKDFLWHLDGIGHGYLLDLGPVWQSTVSFFVERGFKLYTEDLLWAWKEFLRVEEERLRGLPPEEAAAEIAPAARAERFLRGSLQYPDETFDAVLAWDLLDYLDGELVPRVLARLSKLLKERGVVLALFHSRKPDSFHRYRVLDRQSLELLPAPALLPVQRIYQNREILNLFSRFHSSKTFVGRDQLREGLFIK
jgi:hypothetical protein